MAKKEIRTKYIKSLVADKDAMAKQLEESTKESLSSLLDEKVNRSLRQMLAESDNDSYEEEVDTDKPEFNPEPENNDSDEGGAPEGDDPDINVDLGSGDDNADGCDGGECGDGAEGGDVWDEVSDCMDSDGEYDLRGKDIKTVLKVIQNMDTNDGLRIIKNDDDSATVETEDGETEFVIDITDDGDNAEPNDFENEMNPDGDAIDGNDGMDHEGDADAAEGGEGMMDDINLGDIESDNQGDDGEMSFELELGDDNDKTQNDDMVNEGNVNLGYTDNYQNKSAMTMPTDKGEGEGDSRFDDGAPKGGANNKKRWVGHDGQNGGNPYSQKTKQPMTEETNECGANECNNECNEETIFEMEIPDAPSSMGAPSVSEGASTITRNNAYVNSTGRNQIHSPEQDDKVRNGHREAGQKRGTGDGRGTNGTNESQQRIAAIERQASAVLAENKELKDIAAQIKKQLNEAVLINASLAKVIKLITENATSRGEKINILNRFNKVQSLNECKNLYEQISNELKQAHSVNNNNNLLDKQLTENKGQNKNMIVETNMLNQSEDLNKILDLNERLMRLGK
jgi:hypothetical protein